MVKNGSFLYSDFNTSSRHKGRMKKQDFRKFKSYTRRQYLKFKLLRAWHFNNIILWTDTMLSLNQPRLSKIRTIKKTCAYSNRSRSINSFLKLSKYQIARYSRLGLIKDLRKF